MPVTIRIKAPTATQRVDVSAMEPGIAPWNISNMEYFTSPPAASVPKIVSPEIASTLLASETHTLFPDI